jgi:hypothetical protein
MLNQSINFQEVQCLSASVFCVMLFLLLIQNISHYQSHSLFTPLAVQLSSACCHPPAFCSHCKLPSRVCCTPSPTSNIYRTRFIVCHCLLPTSRFNWPSHWLLCTIACHCCQLCVQCPFPGFPLPIACHMLHWSRVQHQK